MFFSPANVWSQPGPQPRTLPSGFRAALNPWYRSLVSDLSAGLTRPDSFSWPTFVNVFLVIAGIVCERSHDTAPLVSRRALFYFVISSTAFLTDTNGTNMAAESERERHQQVNAWKHEGPISNYWSTFTALKYCYCCCLAVSGPTAVMFVLMKLKDEMWVRAAWFRQKSYRDFSEKLYDMILIFY